MADLDYLDLAEPSAEVHRRPGKPHPRMSLRTSLSPEFTAALIARHRPRCRVYPHSTAPRPSGTFTLAATNVVPFVAALSNEGFHVVFLLEVDEAEVEKCDTRCQDATGADCVCACGAKYHGVNEYRDGLTSGWVQVGDTTLVRSNGRRHRVYRYLVPPFTGANVLRRVTPKEVATRGR